MLPPAYRALKSKASRLRDWNISKSFVYRGTSGTWNQKHLDYEIETEMSFAFVVSVLFAWNQKHLDYEIETQTNLAASVGRFRSLEIKSISITRLKLESCFGCTSGRVHLKSKASRLRDWNAAAPACAICRYGLEIKSISITRLKLKSIWLDMWDGCEKDLKSKASRLRDWN